MACRWPVGPIEGAGTGPANIGLVRNHTVLYITILYHTVPYRTVMGVSCLTLPDRLYFILHCKCQNINLLGWALKLAYKDHVVQNASIYITLQMLFLLGNFIGLFKKYIYTRRIACYACFFLAMVENVMKGQTDKRT